MIGPIAEDSAVLREFPFISSVLMRPSAIDGTDGAEALEGAAGETRRHHDINMPGWTASRPPADHGNLSRPIVIVSGS